MDFTVGGERISLTYQQIVRSMKGVEPEPYRKHVVEVGDDLYPPKQVFSRVTGRGRQTFTTLEAQRVLKRLGFVCRESDEAVDGVAHSKSELDAEYPSYLESELITLKLAIGELNRRVTALEEQGGAA